VVDGTWGGNTGKAASGSRTRTGCPDQRRGGRGDLRAAPALTGDKRRARALHGHRAPTWPAPFAPIPDTPYAQAELPCLCYRSAMELLAERHHTTPAALAQLNPGVDTARVAAGAQLWVPNVRRPIVAQRADTGALARRFAEPRRRTGARRERAAGARPARAADAPTRAAARARAPRAGGGAATAGRRAPTPRGRSARPQVARIVVSLRADYLHALDAQGRILLHAPRRSARSWTARRPARCA
jgi:hypothetical protein